MPLFYADFQNRELPPGFFPGLDSSVLHPDWRKEKIAETVSYQTSFVRFQPLNDVGMVPDHEISTRPDQLSRDQDLIRRWEPIMLMAPMQ